MQLIMVACIDVACPGLPFVSLQDMEMTVTVEISLKWGISWAGLAHLSLAPR